MNAPVYNLLQKEPPFRVVAKTDIPAIEMREMLLQKRPRTDPCAIYTIALAKSSGAKSVATQILAAEENTPPGVLARILDSRGHTMTTAQAVAATAASAQDANIFFFTKDRNGVTALACLNRREPILCADDDPRARGVDRILVRNLNNSWPWV